MWHSYNGDFWGMYFFLWVFGILVIAWLLLGYRAKQRQKDSPIDILKKRFARGEITKEEFEEKRQFLANN